MVVKKLLSNREQLCYELGMFVTSGVINSGITALVIFQQIAETHNVSMSDIKELFDELTNYTKQIKSENDDEAELEKAIANHGKKQI